MLWPDLTASSPGVAARRHPGRPLSPRPRSPSSSPRGLDFEGSRPRTKTSLAEPRRRSLTYRRRNKSTSATGVVGNRLAPLKSIAWRRDVSNGHVSGALPPSLHSALPTRGLLSRETPLLLCVGCPGQQRSAGLRDARSVTRYTGEEISGGSSLAPVNCSFISCFSCPVPYLLRK